MDVHYNMIREAQETGLINVEYCPSENMIADILTNPLVKGVYQGLRSVGNLANQHASFSIFMS